MRRAGGSLFAVPAILSLWILPALLAGCAIAGPEGSHRSDCENRGFVRGTAAYNRCLSDAGGRAFLGDFDRRPTFGR